MELILLAAFIGLLVLEKALLARRRGQIPLRVCVTGTRGKSSVTRLIAAALRASGRKVLAKTTGSKPTLILPDGSEREILRSGPATVLEQKEVLALAARLGADALVAEMMSIGPECLTVESHKILRPDCLVVTNARLDHEEEMGRTREAVAESLSAAIPEGCTVLVPEKECFPVFEAKAAVRKSRLIKVVSGKEEALSPDFDFPDNVQLALAAAAHLGVDRETALRGMAAARPDFGALKIWSLVSPVSGRVWNFGSLFAANEPDSTRLALDRLRERLSFRGRKAIVLLNLRADRASRTRRWLSALRSGFFSGFDRVVFIGEQAPALGRLRFARTPDVPGVDAIPGRTAAKVMSALWPMSGEDTVVVGAGNIAGVGRELVELWEKEGTLIPC